MIRATFKHSRKSVIFQTGEEITNLTLKEQEEAVLKGLAYYDFEEPVEYIPTEDNTVKEIKAYLDECGIDYDPSLKKSELLDLC